MTLRLVVELQNKANRCQTDAHLFLYHLYKIMLHLLDRVFLIDFGFWELLNKLNWIKI